MFLPLLPSSPSLQGAIFRRQKDLMCFGWNNPLDSRCRDCHDSVFLWFIILISRVIQHSTWCGSLTCTWLCPQAAAVQRPAPNSYLHKRFVILRQNNHSCLQRRMHTQQVLSVQRQQQLSSPPVTSSFLPAACQAPEDAGDVPHSQTLHHTPMSISSCAPKVHAEHIFYWLELNKSKK